MSTVDLSRLSASDYPKLIQRWKATARTRYKRGSVSVDRVNLILEAETDALSIEFYLLSKTQTLEITIRGLFVGRRINWSMPMADVPSDALVAYKRLVRRAEETGEAGFACRHKRFFLEEWKHFVDLFPGLQS